MTAKKDLDRDFLAEAEEIANTPSFLFSEAEKMTMLMATHTLALMDIARTLRQVHELLAIFAASAAGDKKEKRKVEED